MHIKYEEWNPQEKSKSLVDKAADIIKEYEAEGYTLTLRQLYYQFVARDIIPNTEQSYHNLGSLITRARMAGLISWEAIEDRLRVISEPYVLSEGGLMANIENYIHYDRWHDQPYYVEVWVEKEALGNVIEKACNPYDVTFMSCKGYMSSSAAWRGGQRFKEQLAIGKQCLLIHLGDHDPSGIDMTRDNTERTNLFSHSLDEVDVRRIALNMDQIEEYDPPPNPAKLTDSRAAGYIKLYGDSSWELDALEPSTMVELIQDNIKEVIDDDAWEDVEELEADKKKLLRKLGDKWEEIKKTL